MSGISNLPCGGDGSLEGFQLYEYKFSTDGDSSSDDNPSITFNGKGFLTLIGADKVESVILQTENKTITIRYDDSIYPQGEFSLSPSYHQYCSSTAQATYSTHYLTIDYREYSDNAKFVDLSKTNTLVVDDKYRFSFYYEPKNILTFNEFLKVTFKFRSWYKVNRNIMIVYKPK